MKASNVSLKPSQGPTFSIAVTSPANSAPVSVASQIPAEIWLMYDPLCIYYTGLHLENLPSLGGENRFSKNIFFFFGGGGGGDAFSHSINHVIGVRFVKGGRDTVKGARFCQGGKCTVIMPFVLLEFHGGEICQRGAR